MQDLIDGTMINIFYANDEWMLSTRGDIGGNNKWKNNKSFKSLLNDICDFKLLTSKLNLNYSYSFVLRHNDNNMISKIDSNCLVLVDIFDLQKMEYLTNLYDHFYTDVPFYIISNLVFIISNLVVEIHSSPSYNILIKLI